MDKGDLADYLYTFNREARINASKVIKMTRKMQKDIEDYLNNNGVDITYLELNTEMLVQHVESIMLDVKTMMKAIKEAEVRE